MLMLGWKSSDQLWEIFSDRPLENVEVDVEVVVYQAVAHAGGGTPRDLRQRCAALGSDALGGLADDLDELRQREPEQLVVVEVAALLIRAP